jgi:hypothetical protein
MRSFFEVFFVGSRRRGLEVDGGGVWLGCKADRINRMDMFF